MDKRELFTPLVIAGLAVAFIVVSALVYLSRGDPGLVRRKLRLGGMLLALTGAVNGCGGLTASCYDMAAPNEFSLSDINQDGEVTESGQQFGLTIHQRGWIDPPSGARLDFVQSGHSLPHLPQRFPLPISGDRRWRPIFRGGQSQYQIP